MTSIEETNNKTEDHSFQSTEIYSPEFEENTTDWIADSGATRHMSGDKLFYKSQRILIVGLE